MFRCITELRGFAIDIDSFIGIELGEWDSIAKIYSCIFITSKLEMQRDIEHLFGEDSIILMEDFTVAFAPNILMHKAVLAKLELKNTEIAYVSANNDFIRNANCFLCGSIWVSSQVDYEQASFAPDMIQQNFEKFKIAVERNAFGYYGEIKISPNSNHPGTITPVSCFDDNNIFLYTLGRYFGYTHYMSNLHPYSSAIYLNKKEGKAKGLFDEVFAELFEKVTEQLKTIHNIDGICSVPTKPSKIDRFGSILEKVSYDCKIVNYGEHFTCMKEYPEQKGLTKDKRRENVTGVFEFAGSLENKSVLLIDDIISTGSTLEECANVLKRHGAKKVIVVVLAINQFGNYWSSDIPKVTCPRCKDKMILLINSNNKKFFYSCSNCNKTLSYVEGWTLLCDIENAKFD